MSNRITIIVESTMSRETEKSYSFCFSNKFFIFPKSVCKIHGAYFKKGADNGLPLNHSVYVLSIWKPFYDKKVSDVFKNHICVKVVD